MDREHFILFYTEWRSERIKLSVNIFIFGYYKHIFPVFSCTLRFTVRWYFVHQFRNFFQVVNLGCNEVSTQIFGVRGGYTLEVCLARWWSSLVDGEVEVTVEFHSLRPSQEEVCCYISFCCCYYAAVEWKNSACLKWRSRLLFKGFHALPYMWIGYITLTLSIPVSHLKLVSAVPQTLSPYAIQIFWCSIYIYQIYLSQWAVYLPDRETNPVTAI